MPQIDLLSDGLSVRSQTHFTLLSTKTIRNSNNINDSLPQSISIKQLVSINQAFISPEQKLMSHYTLCATLNTTYYNMSFVY